MIEPINHKLIYVWIIYVWFLYGFLDEVKIYFSDTMGMHNQFFQDEIFIYDDQSLDIE
jgi:hypothetical protein